MDFTPIRLVADGTDVRITSGYTNTTMKKKEIRSVKLLENGTAGGSLQPDKWIFRRETAAGEI